MIAIMSVTYDPDGYWIFRDAQPDNDQGNRSGSRRVSRVATLDGGCSVYDTGYSDSDRTITIHQPSPSRACLEFAAHITSNCPYVIVSTPEGAFRGVPDNYRVVNSELKIDILITERLSTNGQ